MALVRRISPHLPRTAAFVLAPVLLTQGSRTLARVPRLPEAGGPTTGVVGASAEVGAQEPGAAGVGDVVRLLVVGESTAVGVGVDTHEEGMAAALARRIHDDTGRPVRWTVIGRNGARLRTGRGRRLPDVVGEYDLAVVVLGVNDTLGLTSVGRWEREMIALLERTRACLRPGALVVLAGVPQLGAFPALPQPLRFVMGRHGRALDDVLAEIASRHVDVTHVPTPELDDDRDLATDGFHPSGRGYRRWADRLYDEAIHARVVARRRP
ncbi:SGNH/GDSL hydrolase family protein [Mobilicoccus caccae]|uniref:SGNH hydrolase n=1 Tax=Mobilicoccus caccae TaxID=1859295 RepID=A0ABQ6ISY0_9MICO|nr:SGNH/GDSL hydrolase family protein [Mobilicoccus caccae]GMA41020.1 SGNH hydrolase [Mobilicoccus caccae]